jgi:hypothetical protein
MRTFVLVKLRTSKASKLHTPIYTCRGARRRQQPAYVSIRQHTSSYVGIRQHTSATSAYVSTYIHIYLPRSTPAPAAVACRTSTVKPVFRTGTAAKPVCDIRAAGTDTYTVMNFHDSSPAAHRTTPFFWGVSSGVSICTFVLILIKQVIFVFST